MLQWDINCDMGEGIGNDEAIMPFITSANIACGFHAGDDSTMNTTLLLAKKFGVAAGAHISFPDLKNFGRTEMNLSLREIYDLVLKQINVIKKIADAHQVRLNHVKPHGALYNMSAKEVSVAQTIALAVKDYGEDLVLFGLSESHSIKEARRLGVKIKNEAFADRSYQDDGNLTPRKDSNALINDVKFVVQQVLQMVHSKTVTTVSGKTIPIIAETICIHGDGEHAIEFAKAINLALRK